MRAAIVWYRNLSTLERLAVNAWISRGDGRLIAWLRPGSARLKMVEFIIKPKEQDEESSTPTEAPTV